MESSLWTAVRPQHLACREWGEFGAVYDTVNGSTHVLNALALEILLMLSSRAASAEALAREMAADMPPELGGDEITRRIVQQLELMRELGLVQPSGGPA
jgi:PqqD family protein of HPr-rel-A system